MSTKLSVVIPCHNRREALEATLESLGRQTLPAGQFEVIVVDQASTDGCRELVRTMETPYRLHLVTQDAAYGPSLARNAGVEAADCPIVLFLDADIIPAPDLAAAQAACQEANPGALTCGRILPYRPAYTSFVERAANPDGTLDRGDTPGPLPFYEAFSGHLSLAVDTFQRVGPFDPDLKGYEDVDFAYRAHRLGYAIVSCPMAIGYHNHPRTLEQRLAQARAYNRLLPVLMERYPEIRGAIPWQCVNEPIDWQRDSRPQVLAKIGTHFLAFPLVRGAFRQVLMLLDRFEWSPRLAKALYWRLWRASWYLGFREGTAQLRAGPASDSA